jgi:DNA-directed RNA polymerase subunit RPC12/RpoP
MGADTPRRIPELGDISGEPHPDQSHVCPLIMQATADLPSGVLGTRFVCDVAGCGAGPYKQRGSLTRHSKKHNAQQLYECSAVDCVRIGRDGFIRKDKMIDHMLAGHDEESPFRCSTCGGNFPRDIVAAHVAHTDSLYSLSDYRTCPLPRCSHKVLVYVGLTNLFTRLKDLQHHLGKKHDLNARIHYTNLLEQRGYDARTCEVVCPVCPSKCRFPGHVEFTTHFKQVHLDGKGRWNCRSVPDEVRQARHTILRIWPEFKYYPVWEDIKCPRRSN